jgi:hypothetical protein
VEDNAVNKGFLNISSPRATFAGRKIINEGNLLKPHWIKEVPN